MQRYKSLSLSLSLSFFCTDEGGKECRCHSDSISDVLVDSIAAAVLSVVVVEEEDLEPDVFVVLPLVCRRRS